MVAVALLFGLIVVSMTAVAAIGGIALTDTKEELSSSRARKVMTQLDSQAALVALGSTDVRQVELSRGSSGDYGVDPMDGWMKVTITNTSSGSVTTVMNMTMGKVVYKGEETEIAYQGGGVWQETSGSSVMVSPPEFHYRNATLTVPAVNVSGAEALSDEVTIEHVTTNQTYPNASHPNASPDMPFTNPVEDGKVKVTVHSDYYRAWGTFFEQRTDGDVEYDHSRNTVTLILVTPIEKSTVTSASASLAASGKFRITGNSIQVKDYCAAAGGSSKLYTDSYNSTKVVDYCTAYVNGNTGNEGDIVYGEDVDISSGSGNAPINGDIVSGGSVAVGGGGAPEVHGWINYTISCTGSCASKASEGVKQIDGLDTTPAINTKVQATVKDIKNQVGNSGTLDRGTTLTAGKYYYEKIKLTDATDHVVLDTRNGDITIAVRDYVKLTSGATIEVIGSNQTRLYLRGSDTTSCSIAPDPCEFSMEGGSKIFNAGDTASQFRLYGKDNMTFAMEGSGSSIAEFTGVVYAPPGNDGNGTVTMERAVLYGGILTGTTEIKKAQIHYDEALENKKIISRRTNVVRITFLHISRNKIKLEG